MKWESLLRLVAGEPVFSSGLLLSGDVSTAQVRLQLTRWVQAGRLLRLRRGLYALAPFCRKVEPHPFVVANALHPGSYVSLQAALAWYGVIPEHVPAVTSVGPGRPETVVNPLGAFHLHHLDTKLMFGYTLTEVAPGQHAFVATAEKALLDLGHLTPGADSPRWLREMRCEGLDVDALAALAEHSGKPKWRRLAKLGGAL